MTLELHLDDGTVQTLATTELPPLAIVNRCFEQEWLIERNGATKLYIGISAPTHAELGAQNEDGSPKYTASIQHVEGLPDGLRMLYTRYTENLAERGWRDFQIRIFQMEQPSWSRTLLEQKYDSIFAPDRFLNNKKPNAQDAILAAGAAVKLTGNRMRTAGRYWLEIETLCGDGPPPDIEQVNPYVTPWWFMRMVTSRREGFLGGFNWQNEKIVEPWWQLDGADVWVCVLSPTGFNWVPEDRVWIPPRGAPIPVSYNR